MSMSLNKLSISLFFIFGFLWIFPAQAQIIGESYYAKITKSQANEFYETCLEQKYPANTTESKESFCACSSARFYEQLRQNDVEALLFPDTWQAQIAKEKVVQYVYMPCIKDSVTELLKEECEQSTYFDDYPYVSKSLFCDCQNLRNNILFRQSFSSIMHYVKSDLENTLSDPISAFMQNPLFETQAAKITNICMKKATIEPVNTNTTITVSPAPLVTLPGGGHDDHNHNIGGVGGRNEITDELRPIPINVEPPETTPEPQPVVPQRQGPVCRQGMPYDEAYKPENVLGTVEEQPES